MLQSWRRLFHNKGPSPGRLDSPGTSGSRVRGRLIKATRDVLGRLSGAEKSEAELSEDPRVM